MADLAARESPPLLSWHSGGAPNLWHRHRKHLQVNSKRHKSIFLHHDVNIQVHHCFWQSFTRARHSALQSFRAATSAALTSTPAAATSLPIDIAIETVVAILVILVGLVLGASPLRPIQWREWAGKIEREGEDGFKDNNGQVNRDYLGNPFEFIEGRPNFVDIRKQRNEFAEWVKGQGNQQK
ncbi:membrane magnesium transporter-domain-containing protein [Cercophora samala]|uniref:Membrane magnesium transporter-domain-containing protein n=1 Tax=Cercophora samala TaxID=330535 RepID=A0AA40DF86_9PEZI|nr:membrane magnesium transporter-domain-containing protein [Cercophora samala]